VHKLAWNVQHGDECNTLRALSERFFKMADPHGEWAAFLSSRSITRPTANFTLGQVCQKKGGFSSKKHSERAQVHLFGVGVCQNHVVSNDCCGTPFCAETVFVRHRFCFKFLTYFSLVAGLPFLWRHIRTVFIEDFPFIRNYVATLRAWYII